MKLSAVIATLVCILSFASLRAQQPVSLPEQSQKAVVTQRIGLTDVTITYHSPLVKGRKIWDGICPYKQVWRAGANENTTISFTNDVTIEGKPLAAGTYGLHMIPDENEWTIIFSKNHTSWGSFTYNKEEDALRVTVKPQAVPFQEWLSYEFTDREPNSAVAALLSDALEIFKQNVKRHPDSWNVYDSLGEAYGDSGDKKQAVANYKIALASAPENQKQRIEDAVKKLEGK